MSFKTVLFRREIIFWLSSFSSFIISKNKIFGESVANFDCHCPQFAFSIILFCRHLQTFWKNKFATEFSFFRFLLGCAKFASQNNRLFWECMQIWVWVRQAYQNWLLIKNKNKMDFKGLSFVYNVCKFVYWKVRI